MLVPLETFSGWSQVANPSPLQSLGLLVGIPLLIAVIVIALIEIRARARGLGNKPALANLNELGESLARHVRLEEDELFPLIERTLDPHALTALGEELERAEAAAPEG